MVFRSRKQHLITFVVGIACAFWFPFVDAGLSGKKNPLDTFTLLRGGTLDDERSSEAEENKRLDAYIEALIASVEEEEEEEFLDEADEPGDDDETTATTTTEQLIESESQNNSNAEGGLDEIVAIVGSGVVPPTTTSGARPEDDKVVDNDDDDDDDVEEDDEAETVPNHNDAKVEVQVNVQTPSEPADLSSTTTPAEQEEEEEQEEEAEELEQQQKESVDDDDEEEEEEEEKQEEKQEEQQKESVDDDEEEEQQEEKHEEQQKESVDDDEEEEKDEELESVAKEDSVVDDDGGGGGDDEPVDESSPATLAAAAKQDGPNEQDSALPVPASTAAAPRVVYQRPNAVYRFFLNQGRIGHIVVMILISIAEFFRNYFPDVTNVVSVLLESLGGGRTAADRRLQQEQQQVDTNKVINEQYAGFVAQERTSVRGKKRKQALQKADAKAAEQLRRLGSVGNAKYRHVSEAFLRR